MNPIIGLLGIFGIPHQLHADYQYSMYTEVAFYPNMNFVGMMVLHIYHFQKFDLNYKLKHILNFYIPHHPYMQNMFFH